MRGIISLFLAFIFIKEQKREQLSFEKKDKKRADNEKIKKNEIMILLKDKQFNAIVMLNSLRWFLFSGIRI